MVQKNKWRPPALQRWHFLCPQHLPKLAAVTHRIIFRVCEISKGENVMAIQLLVAMFILITQPISFFNLAAIMESNMTKKVKQI